MIEFFLPMVPPTVTQQQHAIKVVKGRPVVYDTPELKDARRKFMAYLKGAKHRISGWDYIFPMDGPVRLVTKWIWPCDPKFYVNANKAHKEGEWKVSKPDTDNLIKLFKDCMTRCCFWHDDAQVCSEITEKFYGNRPGIYVRVETLGSDDQD